MQGFVKIARWNDINFYAVKQAVEKTHKTLHKHIKQFRGVLMQPIGTVLTDKHCDWTDGSMGEENMGSIDSSNFVVHELSVSCGEKVAL